MSSDHTANEIAGDPRGQVALCLQMSFPTGRVWEPSLSGGLWLGTIKQINSFSPSLLGPFVITLVMGMES